MEKSTTTCFSLLEIKVTSGPAGSAFTELLLILVHCWAYVKVDKAANSREKSTFFMCYELRINENHLKGAKIRIFFLVERFLVEKYYQL